MGNHPELKDHQAMYDGFVKGIAITILASTVLLTGMALFLL